MARLEDVNKSLISKWIWRYKTEPRALWRKVIYDIHDSNKRVTIVPCYKVVTGAWKNIAKVYGELVTSDVNLRLLMQYKEGKWYWANNKDGDFSVCSLRKLLARGPDPASNYLYKWSKVVPSKINIFGWRMVRDRLATATNLVKRNIPLPSVLCRLCGQIEEDATHIFIGCEYAAMIWGIVSQWCKLQPIFAFDLKDLLEIPCYITDKKKAKMVYAVILATCWAIWKERNDAAFNNKKTFHSSHDRRD